MGAFHQHPDGIIYVRGVQATYSDTLANFIADFNIVPPALPAGADDHIYMQGRRHAYMGAGNIIAGGAMPWLQGDAIIAALDAGLAAQAARLAFLTPEQIAERAAAAAEATRIATITSDAQVQAWTDRLAISSNAQIDTYFAGNVTTLAQNIAITKALAKIIAAKLRLK